MSPSIETVALQPVRKVLISDRRRAVANLPKPLYVFRDTATLQIYSLKSWQYLYRLMNRHRYLRAPVEH